MAFLLLKIIEVYIVVSNEPGLGELLLFTLLEDHLVRLLSPWQASAPWL